MALSCARNANQRAYQKTLRNMIDTNTSNDAE
jgi:hypothetical protein